ncbi:argininosuccinate lyase [Rehaibacterium terrae]|jgi:argininosuccinate lyase|uniref:Argininosuccinate lyase n=1 Tax=Rehaibacterium terrae TaxID=1341696 RepID=A0A7W7Y1B7_9GAMM|nr:argininosuccinate lyase [Rehaibacterium terrae]MBB5016304.1 argininosuccinate lyase [Rehaibacterium terrae]
MSDLIWQKPGIKIDQRIQRFLAGEDVALDRVLFVHDIRASRAHAEGLARVGILSTDECEALCRELDALAQDWAEGRFVLDERYEDGHSAIEARLIERLGDVGRKIHTGRSRNDQVLVASRLYLRDALAALREACVAIADTALERARVEAMQPLPGYTHLQRAMVGSAGMWWGGWVEAFIDDAVLAADTARWVDANPLGSASGYGVNLALDRDHTTRALGFGRLQVAATYAQLSRGKFELQALTALSQALLDLRRLAWDLSLFTTAEFGFVRLPPEYTTGSSLMPNKRNPDLVELLRASYAVVAGAKAEIEQMLSLPSGYHRDLQFSKGPLLRAFRHGLDALALVPDLLRGLQWNREAIAAAMEPGLFATDKAIELAAAGVPFREAYRIAASEPLPSYGADPDASLAARVSPGAAADLRLDTLAARLAALRAG